MRTLIFQHTAEETAGTLQNWLTERKQPHQIFKGFNGDKLPSAENFDFLVVLGGPMNIDEENKFPFLRDEKKFLESWLKTQKPMLGICLGGQMLAQVLGAKVMRHKHREIGFHEVQKTAEKHRFLEEWPEKLHVFQWHEDHFELPKGCKNLITNNISPHQAFSHEENAIGLQFHPESTKEWILENYRDFETQSEPHVQNVKECAELLVRHLNPMTKYFHRFLDTLAKAKK